MRPFRPLPRVRESCLARRVEEERTKDVRVGEFSAGRGRDSGRWLESVLVVDHRFGRGLLGRRRPLQSDHPIFAKRHGTGFLSYSQDAATGVWGDGLYPDRGAAGDRIPSYFHCAEPLSGRRRAGQRRPAGERQAAAEQEKLDKVRVQFTHEVSPDLAGRSLIRNVKGPLSGRLVGYTL